MPNLQSPIRTVTPSRPSSPTTIDDFRKRLISLSRRQKSRLTALVDIIGFGTCTVRVNGALGIVVDARPGLLATMAMTTLVAVACVWFLGLYSSVIRYVGRDLLKSAIRISLVSAAVGAIAVAVFVPDQNPSRWALVYFAFSIIYLTSSRYTANLCLLKNQAQRGENVLIYGAAAVGAQVVVSLRDGDEFNPVALADDDHQLIGKRIKGLEVYDAADIASVIRSKSVERVLLAMPSASRRRRRDVLERLSEHPVHVQTIPSIGELVSGKARVDNISDVAVEDLLGRDAVPPNAKLLFASILGKSVLVTGAGGSIGSELCRQILNLHPKRLVLLEMWVSPPTMPRLLPNTFWVRIHLVRSLEKLLKMGIEHLRLDKGPESA